MHYYNEELELAYEKYEDHIIVAEGDHNISVANIPEQIDGVPVTGVLKKAFMGCKLLKEVHLPDTIVSVGDFAFALCDNLEIIDYPCKELKLGQSLYKNDFKLGSICVRNDFADDKIMSHTAKLQAAATVVMNADYLIDTVNAGTGEWYRKWDQKLIDILGRKDDEGYHLYVLCGEEDLHFDYDHYISYVKEKKSGLCLLRLINDSFLAANVRERLISYLQDEAENAVFDYLIKNHGEDKEYFDALIEIDVINRNNHEAVLGMLADRYPQTKAYLIEQFAKEVSSQGFFDDLLL